MRSSRRRMRGWRSTCSTYMMQSWTFDVHMQSAFLIEGEICGKTASTMDCAPTFMMPSALQWWNCPRGACPMFDTLYTLAKKLEAGQLAQAHHYAPSSDAY